MDQVGEAAGEAREIEGLEGNSQGHRVVVSGGGIGARERERLAAVQEVLLHEGSREYGRVQREVAARLGISVRSLQRLMQVSSFRINFVVSPRDVQRGWGWSAKNGDRSEIEKMKEATLLRDEPN